MAVDRIDYDDLAASYDQRYAVNPLAGVREALLALVHRLAPDSALEVGCGSGYWLRHLAPSISHLFGLDVSLGMLRETTRSGSGSSLVCADGGLLPFAAGGLDLIFCVNVLHHLDSPAEFISRSHEILRPHGALAVIALDPHRPDHHWYRYDYFPGSYEKDLERFAPEQQVRDWMLVAGFRRLESLVAERIQRSYRGREVLDDYFLRKSSGSHMASLEDGEHTAGMERLRSALGAGGAGDARRFSVDLSLIMIVGWAS